MIWMILGSSVYPVKSDRQLKYLQQQHPNGKFFNGTEPIAMVAYNFQKQFIPALLSGEKHHTIRAEGKRRHAHPGETLQIYTGQRTKHCQKLFETQCTGIQSVYMYVDSQGVFNVEIDGKPLELHEIEQLAVDDGFEEMDGLIRFFESTHGFPFQGFLISWNPPKT